jgi:hypothetical protein
MPVISDAYGALQHAESVAYSVVDSGVEYLKRYCVRQSSTADA